MEEKQQNKWKTVLKDYTLIVVGSTLYALSTVVFVFPAGVLLGGTSGVSVILESALPYSPGTIMMVINGTLTILAFLILGKSMAVRTLVGSLLTTVFVGLLENVLLFSQPLVSNAYLSAIIGAAVIAFASGILFYVDSSSGGTDIVALIVRKYSKIKIGKALLLTDILIVVVGGLLAGTMVLLGSFAGLLVKTFGIDFAISVFGTNRRKKV